MTKITLAPKTPKGERVWKTSTAASGTLYLPNRTAAAVQDALDPNLDLSRLPIIGEGHRPESMRATVYRFGNFAIRITPNNGNNIRYGIQEGIDWLKANIILEEALKAFSTPARRNALARTFKEGIQTPKYFGMLATEEDCRVVMSDCSRIRRIPTKQDNQKSLLVNGYCRAAVEDTYGTDYGIVFDSGTGNILLGKEDAIKLDVYPTEPLPVF